MREKLYEQGRKSAYIDYSTTEEATDSETTSGEQ